MTKRRTSRASPAPILLGIETIGAGGDGVGRHNGRPVYVPKTAPGDRVLVQAEERSEGYYGQILSIETPSPIRAPAPCPHYELCGGCALQHISEADYRAWKEEKVHAVLERSGAVPEHRDAPVFLSAATRRRTTMAVLRTAERLIMGYNAPRRRQITPIEGCMILDPAIDRVLQRMKPYLGRLAPARTPLDVTVQLASGVFDVVLGGPWRKGGFFTLEQNEALSAMLNELDLARVSLREREGEAAEVLLSRKPVVKRFGALTVDLPPGAFLQASDEGEAVLTDFVLRHTEGARSIADLFCGCGTFSGPLLARGAEVYAADSETEAIRALHHPHLRAEQRNLFKNPLNIGDLERFEAVVIDPPRAGAKEQFNLLARSDVPVIISLSCNPATFARDAQSLIKAGYVFERLRIVDQFVWSSHVELAGVFRRG